ncbi:MAG: glycosyl hydrolase, partial [Bacteroidetes bacterium]|nr:glycosyl hydrolase [Bacteroidota bacterium]
MKNPLIYIILLFSQLSIFAQAIVVEAESGTMNGTTTSSSGGVTFVNGLDANDESFTITVNAPSKGTYSIVLRYRSDYKVQDLLLNGTFVSNITLTSTSNTWKDISLGGLMLKAGANTVTIRKNWGYSDFDKFTFTPVPPHDYSLTDANLITPSATQKTKDVYAFLRSQYGKNIISGQTDYWNELIAIAGKTPVIRAFDMQNYSPQNPWGNSNGTSAFGGWDDGSVQKAIDWYNSTSGKGIVSFQWHWFSPSGGQLRTSTFEKALTTFDITKAVITTNTEYTEVIRDIDAIAVQLKRLQTAGIPVLWRPLHEAGENFFWWARDKNACHKLWDIMYDRLTNYHGLNNLIWVWSTPSAAWYPGNSKVDIFGFDSYPADYNYGSQKTVFDQMFSTCQGKKLVAMTENGPIPDPSVCIEDDAMWSYFSSWVDLVAKKNSTQHIKDVYAHTNVITLDEVTTIVTTPVITPYTQINGGTWAQTNVATLCAGETVSFGPHPNIDAGWTWTGPNNFTATTRQITFTNITANKAGNYIATYTDGNGNQGSKTFTITVNALPTATITTTTPTTFCEGGSVVLTASAGTSYKWYNGTTALATTTST